MNTKYRYKPLEIDALQFSPTPQGIADIALFAGADFTGVNLNGHPLPAAFVNGLVIPEGSWIIRNASGMYKVLKDSVFTAVCEVAGPDIHRGETVIPVEDAAPVEKLTLSEMAAQARARGDDYFTPTAPFVRGHMDQRYASNGSCVTCQRAASALSQVRQMRAKLKASEALQQPKARWLAPVTAASIRM